MSLGPGMPDPPASIPVPVQRTNHTIDRGFDIVARPILGGLHHEYALVPDAAA